MKSPLLVLQEQVEHFYLIRRLSLYEIKSKNKNNYLGMSWELINPVIQLLIYWFVFGTLRDRQPVEVSGNEIQFFSWLMIGFLVWIFFYQSTIQGSKSIFSRLKILSKMNFPMSIIPNFIIFSNFYVHLAMLFIATIVLLFMGYNFTFYIVQILYFILASFCLVYSISLITSTLSTIIRDIHMLLNSTLRMFLYVSGVLWPLTLLDDFPTLMKIAQLNPLYYIIQGYRTAYFGDGWYFVSQWEATLVFWGLVLIFFLIGSYLHVRFRRHFIDYL